MVGGGSPCGGASATAQEIAKTNRAGVWEENYSEAEGVAQEYSMNIIKLREPFLSPAQLAQNLASLSC